jgi:hypothetical protein
MSTGAIIGIIIAVIVVAAVVVVAFLQLRRARIRRQFGPEYSRLAKEMGPRKADAELTARRRRVDALDIHPLSARQQARYSTDWAVVQERFVDAPVEAVTTADTLIWDAMRDSGYAADDKNASTEALSVHHARSFEGYRQAQVLPTATATTEELREALIRYRALFEDLTGLHEGPGTSDRDHAAEAGPGEPGIADGRIAASGDLAAQNRRAAAESRNLAAEEH